jgi:hypothetical protein
MQYNIKNSFLVARRSVELFHTENVQSILLVLTKFDILVMFVGELPISNMYEYIVYELVYSIVLVTCYQRNYNKKQYQLRYVRIVISLTSPKSKDDLNIYGIGLQN